MGGRGGSMGGSHGMGGGAAANAAAPAPQAAPQTRDQQLLAQIKGNPATLMQMSDQDALDTVKEIEKMPLPDDGTHNNTLLQRYLVATGLANEKPIVLDETAFEAERQKIGARVLYHSDEPLPWGGIESTRKTQKQLQNGDTAYASCGIHGSGTYLDTDAYNNVMGYGWGGTQVKLFLNKNARVAHSADLLQAEANFRTKHPKTHAYLLSLGQKLGKHKQSELKTIYLTSSGYNAFSRPGGYKVAYSRKALTICDNIRDASTVKNNW